MKRLLTNGIATLALALGLASFSSPAFAVQTLQSGPTCGNCECYDGQNCTSGPDGCGCWYPEEAK